MKKLVFEAQFNNNPKNICRTLAHTEAEAKKELQEFYPNDTITKIYEPC